MSDSANITLVRRLYDSGMDAEVVSQATAPDIVWDVLPGFPGSGIFHGWESVRRDFFRQFMAYFESFSADAEGFYADEEGHVFVYGHYHARPKGGSEVQVRFIHFWTVRDGKLAHLVVVADSHILQQALGA